MFYLDPRVKKGGYTREEDRAILYHQRILGNRWAEIASHLPRRTENDIKIRFRVLEKKGFDEEVDFLMKRPSPRSSMNNHIRLRQVAAQAMSCLQNYPDSAVFLPGHGRLPMMILEGDAMDTSSIPPFEVPLYLIKHSNGALTLADSSNQVVWKESDGGLDMWENYNPLVKEGVDFEQNGNGCGLNDKEQHLDQLKVASKDEVNVLLETMSCISHPIRIVRNNEEEYNPVVPNEEFPYRKLPGSTAIQCSSPNYISPEQTAADAAASWGEIRSYVVGMRRGSSGSGMFSDNESKKRKLLVQGLNALATAADITTLVSGTIKRQ